jgi:hypothetical protein
MSWRNTPTARADRFARAELAHANAARGKQVRDVV